MKHRYRALAAATAMAMAAGACGSSSNGGGGGGNTASAPGVTASTITIGLVTSLTGAAAPEYNNTPKAVQARIDELNALGGIDGRKLNLVVKDDQSSPAGNQNASCEYFTRLQGSTFVPVPSDGKPVCGTKIPNSNVGTS